METWQSPVYCASLENWRVLKGPVSSNLTVSANLLFEVYMKKIIALVIMAFSLTAFAATTGVSKETMEKVNEHKMLTKAKRVKQVQHKQVVKKTADKK